MKTCNYPGCPGAYYAKGWCNFHYLQAKDNRTLTEYNPRPRISAAERFWAKVDILQSEGCWLWTSTLNNMGYGVFYLNGKHTLAHRTSLSWFLERPLQKGLVVDHLCHNPRCVRPDHLRETTQAVNVRNPKSLRSDNTSGFRGVTWHKGAGKWAASVTNNGEFYYLGLFETAEQAGLAAEDKRMELSTDH